MPSVPFTDQSTSPNRSHKLKCLDNNQIITPLNNYSVLVKEESALMNTIKIEINY